MNRFPISKPVSRPALRDGLRAAHIGVMTISPPPGIESSPESVTAAVLSVEPDPSGRALVTFRSTITAANPSGRESAYTPLLSTKEGAALAAKLRARVNPGPVRRRNTTLDFGVEPDTEGGTIRVIRRAA